MSAPVPANEAERLEALHSLDVLDSAPEPAFDQLVQQAARLLGAPIALVSLVDADRQWFKARLGLELTQTERDQSFCAHALERSSPLVVPDARADERFAANPLVTSGPEVRSYAGAQIRTPEGYTLGTVCVLDQEARQFSGDQLMILRMLGEEASALLRLRSRLSALVQLADDEAQATAVVQEAELVLADAQRRRGDYLVRLTDRTHRTFSLRHTTTGAVEARCICGWTSMPSPSAGIAGAQWDGHRVEQR